ncbi:hypothetical protein B0H10DRAFT_2236694 [Mycena sp. CBHHK59/15]|nr:hypothetical protein B0H10DRAFT_2236694 [Mycena sp. CBHHK59/15]
MAGHVNAPRQLPTPFGKLWTISDEPPFVTDDLVTRDAEMREYAPMILPGVGMAGVVLCLYAYMACPPFTEETSGVSLRRLV